MWFVLVAGENDQCSPVHFGDLGGNFGQPQPSLRQQPSFPFPSSLPLALCLYRSTPVCLSRVSVLLSLNLSRPFFIFIITTCLPPLRSPLSLAFALPHSRYTSLPLPILSIQGRSRSSSLASRSCIAHPAVCI